MIGYRLIPDLVSGRKVILDIMMDRLLLLAVEYRLCRAPHTYMGLHLFRLAVVKACIMIERFLQHAFTLIERSMVHMPSLASTGGEHYKDQEDKYGAHGYIERGRQILFRN